MVEIEQFIGKTISGQKLYELLGEMPLLKFMNDNDSHYGMQYVTGNNLDILPFNGTGECCKGGLYVTTLKSFPHHYKRYGAYARRVRINPNALVYVEKNKIKCNEIYLDDRILKDDLLKMLFAEYLQYLDNLSKDKMEDFLLSMMTKSFIKMYMKLIDPQFLTQKILFKIINIGGEFIEFINDEMRTPELLMEAVKSNGNALEFIKDEMRTPDLLMEAVKSNGYVIRFIKDEMRTPELLMETVKSDGYVLRFIKDEMMTPELLMEAVKSNGNALEFIKDEMRISDLLTSGDPFSAEACQ